MLNLTRFHGVFAPNSKYRSKVTPARRGKRKKCHSVDEADQTPAEKRASITWAKRLKRVFNIDIETCSECGDDVRIIACIEDPVVIQKILVHLENTASSAATALLPDCRASPCLPLGLFDWRKQSTMALACCFHFGYGMADLVPASRIGEKSSCIRPIFGSERGKLASLRAISIERPVWMVVWYFEF